MYAVIKTGGKQYRVAVGDRLKVESLAAEAGATLDLSDVLLVGSGDAVQVGTPTLDTLVQATVVSHGRGDKVHVFKLRRRQNSRVRTGHRQNYTELEITRIGDTVAPAKTKPAEPQPDAKPAEPQPEAEPAAPPSTESAPEAASSDDLTQINGIGPVIVKKLEGLGITTFAQIAAFTDADIARIDEELNFKGRIARDDWVGQAKQLMKA